MKNFGGPGMDSDSPSYVRPGFFKAYEGDYYHHLVLKEEERRKKFLYKGRSPQLNHRKDLLEELYLLSKKLKLSNTTYHLAVHLLDIFMDHHEIDVKQLMLAASSCLLISAKYVDVDMNIPRISRLQDLLNNINSTHEYKTMELMLLNFWRWDLNFATSLHFLDYFMTGDMLYRCTEGLVPFNLHLDDFKRKVLLLADMALTEAEFVYFKSSKVAAACVATIRFNHGHPLIPTWTPSLEFTTGYSYVDIHDCVQLLRNLQFRTMAPVIQPVIEYKYYEVPLKTEPKWKSKAPPTSYNSARDNRRPHRPLLSKRELRSTTFHCPNLKY